ncbi:protein kinase domain-containing protein [Undibacterium sp. TJN19]|uniref:protein kinase domain-containing protein n=1 Tax=Undibacterium sp. TJN19 TaxID=3413055 RepID=UPI003BF0D263
MSAVNQVSQTYIRRCPACETENAPDIMRCACGTLLSGVDLMEKRPPEEKHPVAVTALPDAIEQPQELVCAYEDCAQPNPPGSTLCVYCNRPFASTKTVIPASAHTEQHLDQAQQALQAADGGQIQSLLVLPSTLRERYTIVRPLTTQGAEAELLLVQEQASAILRVAKIYRHGIHARSEVMERLKAIPPEHRVVVLEAGISDGYTYELMEYCALGSLRQLMQAHKLSPGMLENILRELAEAIASVHAVGLIHRDLKPENILLRTLQPLDLILTDFGISSILDATQRLTGTARTLPYASPESLSGVIDAKADYWALGMIMLELALGQHPFAGLSEAVILHHLTTRELELTAISDPYLRKLLRGLLLRDPKLRWDESQIRRWLARDSNLPDAVETISMRGFREPYHIGRDICHTREQLAVALARNWHDGVTDIANAQLLAWFRDVQKDQNAVRVLLDLRQNQKLSIDVQLLKLIVHLAPGIPPVWRGESIELPGILAYANRALKGDEAAASWLHQIYSYGVLEAFADAGNKEIASIVEKWQYCCRQIQQAWHEAYRLMKEYADKCLPGEHSDVDKLLYSLDTNDNAPLHKMHARVLALAYDERWPERLRKRLLVAYAGLQVYCPWLASLGEVEQMSVASLLVLEAMLPEAQKVAERQQKAEAWQRTADHDAAAAMKQEVLRSIKAIRVAATDSMLPVAAVDNLRIALDEYYELLTTLRASASTEVPWQEAKKAAVRVEHIAAKLGKLAKALTVRRTQNRGWIGQEMQVFVVIALILVPLFFRWMNVYAMLALFAGLAGWRFLPNYLTMRKIRELGEQL